MSGAVTRAYTFTDGSDAYGSQVEGEFNTLFNNFNNLDAGTSKWTVVDALTIKRNGTTILPILQIVTATTATNSSTTSSTFQDTALTASITPGSTSNKILVFSQFAVRTAVVATRMIATIKRGSTNLLGATEGGGTTLTPAAAAMDSNMTLLTLDSPASTSSTTYTIQIKSSDNTNTVSFIPNTTLATIILIEVGY